MKTVKLETIHKEYCFYKGSFIEDQRSTILITGCKNKLISIQIQSALFGDTLGTSVNGTVVILQGGDHFDDIVENPEYDDLDEYSG